MTTRSLRAEIVAGFAALVLALAVVGGYALARQARAVQALRLQNQGYLPLSLQLGEAYTTQTTMDTLLERVIEERDRALSRTWISSARRTRRGVLLRARALAASARGDARSREDVEVLGRVDRRLASVERAWREDERAFPELFEALAAGNAARARAVHRPLLEREVLAADELRQAVREVLGRTHALAAEAEQEQPRTLRVLSVVTVAALAAGLFTLLSARRALRPLALLIDRVRAVARGDLTPRLVHARADEIGELAREFDNMVDAVKARDTALREKAEAIRQAEQHLEQVVATLRAAVMVVAHDGVVRSANPAARRLAEGAALDDARFADTPFGRVEAIARAVAETCAGTSSGASLLAVPMGDRALDVAVATFAAPAGQGTGALVVADDVTEREQARARLLQNERLAAIGRMAAHVTHEVRNPLSSMALNAEMLADEARTLGPGAREVERLVGAIQREIDRLTAITEEYLRVARLPRPRLEREDVGALVDEAVGFVAAEFARAGIELRVDAVPETTAMLDEAQIRQALLNLLRNAREVLETRPAGARRVRVGVAPAREGVEITVADSGPGIRPEVRAHLFELFFTTKERGSGLGLPLTREIVLAHGGRIDVGAASAEEGGGARFVIWLPASPAHTPSQPEGGARDAA
jgi:nitrogen fixation/metabolism regulation signal transduction histidine kinase